MFAALLATAATSSSPPVDPRLAVPRGQSTNLCGDPKSTLAISQSVVSPQPASDRFTSELVEVPVRYAAVHILGETNDVAPVPDISREEVLHVDRSDRQQ